MANSNSIVSDVAGSVEGGVEKGVWTGVAGAIIGFMVLPVIAGLAVGGLWPTIGGALEISSNFWASSLAGAIATATTMVAAYPMNKRFANYGTLIGGVLGFAKGAEEAEQAKQQEVLKAQMKARGIDPDLSTQEVAASSQELAGAYENTPSFQVDANVLEYNERAQACCEREKST